ncbi:MAG: hypothetical protein LBH43_20155 [Treponema sp.]|nr:hypothetical protein [Treponema sp.]
MKKDTTAIFRQSLGDFPCPVALGKETPSFGLHRYKQGLRFVPLDDEGFSLRGDRRWLLYKGRRRSHRFTILGDAAFEYDCILEREPESNVVSLRMDGAECFDFFRQPDFVQEPFFKGSYAVYKKETLIGEGTGKLCHIHRPQIIDARGRRCWGDLAVIGNELRITIPEWWLSEAAYPVIVDPTIGTATVGSQNKWVPDESEPPETLYFEMCIPVNRFLISETINGSCTAYAYTNADDFDAGGRPVLYSDNGNSPLVRKSANESLMDFRVVSGKPAGWRSAAFNSNGSIASGSYIWFGVSCEYIWYPRFDFGSKCYYDDWQDVGDGIPNSYPIYNVNWYENFKLSMYFTYSSAQNYARTLTQGVSLSDSRKLTGNYKRSLVQTAKVNSLLGRFETFCRKCEMTAHNAMNVGRLPLYIRNVSDHIKVTLGFDQTRSIFRKCVDGIDANSQTSRVLSIFRKVMDEFSVNDNQSFSVLVLRCINDNVTVSQQIRHLGAFFRGLSNAAESRAETRHKTEYYRVLANTVQTTGAVFRGLLLLVRIVSTVFIRDFVLGRFLKAREELILKSVICRELELVSKIQ